MIQTVVVTLLCYFVVCFMLLIMVLEYLPGTGKTSHLLHKNQLYYRVGETCRMDMYKKQMYCIVKSQR